MSDLASVAAATAAGYVRTQLDRGAVAVGGKIVLDRYETTFTKMVVGGTNQSGFELRATGSSPTSAAAADTVALNALNNLRGHRYGFGSGTNKDSAVSTAKTDTQGVVEVRDAS
jgi:hypothetical protein